MSKKGFSIYEVAHEHIYNLPPIESIEDRNNLTFILKTDGHGRGWLYTYDSKSPASQIYVTDSADWSQAGAGFGGSTLKFNLVSGGVFELRGGWHSNSDSLFANTGIDFRDAHLTLVHIWSPDGKLLYEETEWVLGKFDREDDILKSLGLEDKKVFVARRSSGGSSCGWRNFK